ncbi:MAG: ISAs1 family transposase [Colwellia sp.]|nr:ISAs1 family transposase [Colwellia sp.]
MKYGDLRQAFLIKFLGAERQLEETEELFAKAVRRHWSVENSLHWVLDVSFREDESRIRRENGAENMATARHITLNMLRQEKSCKKGIKRNDLKQH